MRNLQSSPPSKLLNSERKLTPKLLDDTESDLEIKGEIIVCRIDGKLQAARLQPSRAIFSPVKSEILIEIA